MKKLIVLVLALMLLSITACADAAKGSGEQPANETKAVAANADGVSVLCGILLKLTAEDIKHIDYDSVTAAELAPLLNKVPSQLIDHTLLAEGDSPVVFWSIYAFLDSIGQYVYSGDDAINLSAGLEEELVELSYRGEHICCKNKDLYWLIRRSKDSAGEIDAQAYAEVREAFSQHMAEKLAYYANLTPKAGYSDYELTSFQKAASFDDLLDGVVTVCKFNYALIAEHPEKAGWAGGMYLDSRLRLFGFENSIYLIAVFHDGTVAYTQYVDYELFYGRDEASLANAKEMITAELKRSYY